MTLITNTGWTNDNGNILGTWTDAIDQVLAADEIRVATSVNANTLAGNDIISSDSEGINIFNSGTINTGNGNDLITGINGIVGIFNSGTINTGNGNDRITGDVASAGGDIGIFNSGTINTGIIGSDTITGSGGEIGVFNSGTIVTSRGRDIIDALDGGFQGNGTVNLNNGNDIIRGFGQQTINGGNNTDTAVLGLDFDQVTLSAGIGLRDIDIVSNGQTMSFSNVEMFDFNSQMFTLQQLQAQAT